MPALDFFFQTWQILMEAVVEDNHQRNLETPASKEERLQFLTSQIEYLTAHFQIADTKAAGVIAYMSLLISFTVSKLDLSKGAPFTANQWNAIVSLTIGGLAVIAALTAIWPRAWPGRYPTDTFSWVGLAARSKLAPYTERITSLTSAEMEQSLADVIENSSLTIRRKYRLITFALLASLLSSTGQAAYWLFN